MILRRFYFISYCFK